MEKKALTPAQRKKRAALRAKRRRQRRLLLGAMALLILLLIGGLVWLLLSASHEKTPPEAEPLPTPSAEPPAETPSPTEPPVSATMPPYSIEEEWYKQRCLDLYRYMKAYGAYEDDGAIYAKIDTMQIDKQGKLLALTFDDGPYSPYTEGILDVLEQYNARATFFVKGDYIQGGQEQIKRALALGCEIGNHTMSHEDLEKLDEAAMRQSVGQVQTLLKELFDYECHLLRPPYISYGEKGSQKRNEIISMCEDYGLVIVNHTRSSHDTYAEYNREMIVERMLLDKDELGKGKHKSIFLFHDKYNHTVEAIKQLIPAYLQEGYQLVTVSELLHCSEEGFHIGWVYSKAD